MISKGKKEKAIVLLSGGIDSTVTLYFAKKHGFSPSALIFDYGQRHGKEVSYAVRNAKKLKLLYRLIRITLPWGGSALTDRRIKVPEGRRQKGVPSTYVPGRNIIFLSFAVSFAECIRARKIFIGAHIQDYSGYPDCRPGFLRRFQGAVNAGIKHKNIEIIAPLLQKKKAEIIRLGLSLKVDFKDTWSCYKGMSTPCGKCDSCRFRIQGFKEVGIRDPLMN